MNVHGGISYPDCGRKVVGFFYSGRENIFCLSKKKQVCLKKLKFSKTLTLELKSKRFSNQNSILLVILLAI